MAIACGQGTYGKLRLAARRLDRHELTDAAGTVYCLLVTGRSMFGNGGSLRSVIAVLMFYGCASIAVDETYIAPASTTFSGIQLSTAIHDPHTLLLSFRNDNDDPVTVHLDILSPEISQETVNSNVLTGFESREVCEGDVCRIVNVPLYETVASQEHTHLQYSMSADSVVLEENEESAIEVRLLNHNEATMDYSITMLVTLVLHDSTHRLRIIFPSEELALVTDRDDDRWIKGASQ